MARERGEGGGEVPLNMEGKEWGVEKEKGIIT